MSGTIIKAGVMGWPVVHSLSPRLHNYWLKQYGIDGRYEAMAVKPEDLEQELRSLRAKGFRGVNLTIPHKEAALKIVNYIAPLAHRIGAINTVIVCDDGTLEGRNTDAFGFTQSLLSEGVKVRGKIATVLGAGGASRAVIVALQDMGASEIRLANRTTSKAESLAKTSGGLIKIFAWNDVQAALNNAGLLINTTSLGMKGQPPLDISLDSLPKDATVTDIVYSPLETDLLRRAKQRGNKTVDGLGMLLHQAVPAFEAWFDKKPEVTAELRTHVIEGLK